MQVIRERVCFPCGSAGTKCASNVGDLGSTPGLGRSPGEGKGYPLQYADLENSMDFIVHGVAKSRTRLSNFHFHVASESLGRLSKLSHAWAHLRQGHQNLGYRGTSILGKAILVTLTVQPLVELGSVSLRCPKSKENILTLPAEAPCMLKYHDPQTICIPTPPLSTRLFPPLSTSQVLPLFCFFSAHISNPLSTEGAFGASPLLTAPLLPSLLTCPVGQRAPEGLGMCSTVLQTIGQALDQDILTVEEL